MTAPPDPPAAGAQPHSHLLLNRVITTVLRSALHPLLSRNLALLTYRGRKPGRAYTIPVSYLRDGDQVTVFSNQRWWRNLRGGARVELRLRGKRVPGHAEVHEDGPTVVAAAATTSPAEGRRRDARSTCDYPTASPTTGCSPTPPAHTSSSASRSRPRSLTGC